VEAHESYRYVSNSGTPMLLDLFFFDKHQRELRRHEELIVYDERHNRFVLNPAIRNKTEYAKRGKEAADCYYVLGSKEISAANEIASKQRIDLGSSYVREKGKDKLLKDEALALLEGGVPISEILETYSGFTDHQLRAFKAHITMGTYGKETDSKSEA